MTAEIKASMTGWLPFVREAVMVVVCGKVTWEWEMCVSSVMGLVLFCCWWEKTSHVNNNGVLPLI